MENQRDRRPPNNIHRPAHRRPTRRSAHAKASKMRVPVLVAFVVLCGFGINRALAHFVQQPVMVVQAAQQSSSQAAPESEPDKKPFSKEDIILADNTAVVAKPVSTTALPTVSMMPCYTDDAFVIDYLNVPKPVETHPLLNTLSQTNPAAVAVGGSGFGNISHWKTNVNGDTMGWLSIPGTNINYPVVQGPYTDYYTTKGYDKNYSHAGVIWASSSSNVSGGAESLSGNTVLFGHNWTNYSASPRIGNPGDTHFAQLTAFQHLDFARNHQYIWFSTAQQEMKWQIFAAFYTDINFDYINAGGGSGIINGAIARSEHNYDVAVSSSDKILTLSTCTRRFGASNRQRFVVMAKLVSGSSPVANVTANPSPVRPNL